MAWRSAGGHTQTSAGFVTRAASGLGVEWVVAPLSGCGSLPCGRGASSLNEGLGGGKGGEVGADCPMAPEAIRHANDAAAKALCSARQSVIAGAHVHAHTQVIRA